MSMDAEEAHAEELHSLPHHNTESTHRMSTDKGRVLLLEALHRRLCARNCANHLFLHGAVNSSRGLWSAGLSRGYL